MLFKALSFSLVTFRAVGINQKKRMMYYIRNERSLKMQRITALELKPGPKKCIVIVHIMAIQVVEFSNGGYKIRKIFA